MTKFKNQIMIRCSIGFIEYCEYCHTRADRFLPLIGFVEYCEYCRTSADWFLSLYW
jgi:hypothetical protein